MTEKLKTKVGTIFTTPKPNKHAAANGSRVVHSPSPQGRRATMPPPPPPQSPSASQPAPNLRTDIFSPSQSGTEASSRASTRSPPKLPSRPKPTHPPPSNKSSTPLPSKMRHNSYPMPDTTSSPSIRLRSKTSARPALFMPRNERNATDSRIATAESEACNANLLRQGIKTRDFQREADERVAYLRSEVALRKKIQEAQKVEGDKEVLVATAELQDKIHGPRSLADSSHDTAFPLIKSRTQVIGDRDRSNGGGGGGGGGGDHVVFQGRRDTEKPSHSTRLRTPSM